MFGRSISGILDSLDYAALVGETLKSIHHCLQLDYATVTEALHDLPITDSGKVAAMAFERSVRGDLAFLNATRKAMETAVSKMLKASEDFNLTSDEQLSDPQHEYQEQQKHFWEEQQQSLEQLQQLCSKHAQDVSLNNVAGNHARTCCRNHRISLDILYDYTLIPHRRRVTLPQVDTPIKTDSTIQLRGTVCSTVGQRPVTWDRVYGADIGENDFSTQRGREGRQGRPGREIFRRRTSVGSLDDGLYALLPVPEGLANAMAGGLEGLYTHYNELVDRLDLATNQLQAMEKEKPLLLKEQVLSWMSCFLEAGYELLSIVIVYLGMALHAPLIFRGSARMGTPDDSKETTTMRPIGDPPDDVCFVWLTQGFLFETDQETGAEADL
jgi:hypothetical protein